MRAWRRRRAARRASALRARAAAAATKILDLEHEPLPIAPRPRPSRRAAQSRCRFRRRWRESATVPTSSLSASAASCPCLARPTAQRQTPPCLIRLFRISRGDHVDDRLSVDAAGIDATRERAAASNGSPPSPETTTCPTTRLPLRLTRYTTELTAIWPLAEVRQHMCSRLDPFSREEPNAER